MININFIQQEVSNTLPSEKWNSFFDNPPLQLNHISIPEIESFIQSKNFPIENSYISYLEKSNGHPGLVIKRSSNTATIFILKEVFLDIYAYYSSLFHEITHYAGFKLDSIYLKEYRKIFFANESACMEEIIAEIGSLLLLEHFKICKNYLLTNSMRYIKYYIDSIEKNNYTYCIEKTYLEALKRVNYILK